MPTEVEVGMHLLVLNRETLSDTSRTLRTYTQATPMAMSFRVHDMAKKSNFIVDKAMEQANSSTQWQPEAPQNTRRLTTHSMVDKYKPVNICPASEYQQGWGTGVPLF